MKYVSDLKELSDKKYNSIKELEAAEAEVKEKQAAKETLAKTRKSDAEKVEKAFKEYNTAKRDYDERRAILLKNYRESVYNLNDQYIKSVDETDKVLAKAEEKYNKVFQEFVSKHPEGYHMTLKDGDNIITLSSKGNGQVELADVFKEINNETLNFLRDLFR